MSTRIAPLQAPQAARKSQHRHCATSQRRAAAGQAAAAHLRSTRTQAAPDDDQVCAHTIHSCQVFAGFWQQLLSHVQQSLATLHAPCPPHLPAPMLLTQGPAAATGIPPTRVQLLDPNVWSYKPVWCQPWSIVATGAAAVGGVWAMSGHSFGWAAVVAVPVAAWWLLFLGLYPAQFREYAESTNAQQQRQWGEQLRQRGEQQR